MTPDYEEQIFQMARNAIRTDYQAGTSIMPMFRRLSMNRRQTRFLPPVLHPMPMRMNMAASPPEQRAQRFMPGSAEYRHVEPMQWDEYAGLGRWSPQVLLEDVGRGA